MTGDEFLAWLDAKTQQAEAARHASKIVNPLEAEQNRIISAAFRIVALEYIKEHGIEMENNPSLEQSPQTGAP